MASHQTNTRVTAGAKSSLRNRHRVRWACEECRRKKIKCDGSNPCPRCKRYGVNCFYLNLPQPLENVTSSDGLRQNIEQLHSTVEELKSRVLSTEQLFRQFLENSDADTDLQRPNPSLQHHVGDFTGQGATVETIAQVSSSTIAANGNGVPDDTYSSAHFTVAVQGKSTGKNTAYALGHKRSYPQSYADSLGELDIDTNGRQRYIGLGAMGSVVDTCVGIRQHVNRGLIRKGYTGPKDSYTGPSVTTDDEEEFFLSISAQSILLSETPTSTFVDFQLEIYERYLFNLYPIIPRAYIREVYDALTSNNEENPDAGFAALFFAAMAATVPLTPNSHAFYETQSYNTMDFKYCRPNIGARYYRLAVHFLYLSSSNKKCDNSCNTLNLVIANGLLGVYLAETGNQAEAWVTIGRAIRLGQDVGLHRSPNTLLLPPTERVKRRYIWWCLYSLDRQLSMSLGRPMSIDDRDCNVEIPCEENDRIESLGTAGFVSLITLNMIIGKILRIINSAKHGNEWQHGRKHDELRSRIRELNMALQAWAKDGVPERIKTAKSGTALMERHVALSTFFGAIILLHRAFIPNRHRSSPLPRSDQLECAKAATNLIRGTADFLESLPKRSHHVIFHGQYVFTSSIVLMRCLTTSDNEEFITTGLRDIEIALHSLRGLGKSWAGAGKLIVIAEEYLEILCAVMEGNHPNFCKINHTILHAEQVHNGSKNNDSSQQNAAVISRATNPEMDNSATKDRMPDCAPFQSVITQLGSRHHRCQAPVQFMATVEDTTVASRHSSKVQPAEHGYISNSSTFDNQDNHASSGMFGRLQGNPVLADSMNLDDATTAFLTEIRNNNQMMPNFDWTEVNFNFGFDPGELPLVGLEVWPSE